MNMNSHHDDSPTAALSEKLLSGAPESDPEEVHVVMDEATTTGAVGVGEKQPNQFRDAWAAILFLSHLCGVFYISFAWGVPSLDFEYKSYGSTDEVHFAGFFYLCLTASVAALIVSGMALSIMSRFAEQMVQISLFFSIGCSVLIMIFFLAEKVWIGAVISFITVLWGAWYAHAVWRRIPFAAANLKTGLTALRSNGGLSIMAYAMVIIVNLFSILWMLAFLGVYARTATCEQGECTSHMNGMVIVLFLLSYYWTCEVGKNVVHATTSGVVGTWWFAPDEASGFCSKAVTDSGMRASTYSLGSICLGSLLTALLQVAYHLVIQARRQSRGSSLVLCIVECLIGFLERVVAYFNKWAYVYIGLYGYDYLTAGKKVMDLFLERGWTTIINDDLVLRVCSLMALVIGLITGCIGLALGELNSSWVDEFGSSATAVSFLMPFFVGTAIAYILMGVVASAVDTVIVAFAEAPLDFERNHPGLHQQMVNAWGAVYPDEFGSH